jgi:hypothetical protein
VALYKPYGQLLVVDPPRKVVEEVSVRDLSRDTSAVLGRVRAGGRAIITSRGTRNRLMVRRPRDLERRQR